MVSLDWRLILKKAGLLVILLSATCVSFFFVFSDKSSSSYILAAVSLILLTAVYAVEILDLMIGGNHLSLQKRLKKIQHEQKETKKLVTTMVMISRVYADAAGRFGGTPQEHHNLVDNYIQSLIADGLLEEDWESRVVSDIEGANEEIERRNHPEGG